MKKLLIAICILYAGSTTHLLGNWKYAIEGEEVKITGYRFTESGTDLVVPSEIEGKPVTSIAVMAFRTDSELQSIVIPGEFNSIPEGAFIDCDYLTTVTIAEGVTLIESRAFQNCERLQNINIPDSVTSIESYAFDGCIRLPRISIGNGVTFIDYLGFNRCQSLQEIYFRGDAPTLGGDDVFQDVPLDSVIYYYTDRAGWGFYLGGVATQGIAPPDPTKWGKYTVPDTTGPKWIDTGGWLGWVDVTHRPWVWRDETQEYIYVPDTSAMAGSGWNYTP